MKITIHDNRKVSSVQQAFNHSFPYLKLEFFAKGHKTGGASSKKLMKKSDCMLSECRTTHHSGRLAISGSMTVAELEQRFADIYGLHVQVFRRSGNVWLETTVTDDWTLDEQNREGEALCAYLAANRKA